MNNYREIIYKTADTVIHIILFMLVAFAVVGLIATPIFWCWAVALDSTTRLLPKILQLIGAGIIILFEVALAAVWFSRP